MKAYLLRLWCRIVGHKPHHEPLKPIKDETGLYPGGISAYVMTVPYCERCGNTDLYGWVMTKGYLEKTEGNVDVLKGKRCQTWKVEGQCSETATMECYACGDDICEGCSYGFHEYGRCIEGC